MGTGRELLAESRYQAAVEALQQGASAVAVSAGQWALHLQPRHTDASRLRERVLNQRAWHADGSPMRAVVRELLRVDAGLPRRAVFGRPDVEALLPEREAEPVGEEEQ